MPLNKTITAMIFERNVSLVIIVLMTVLLVQCKTKTYDTPHVRIETEYGDMEAELFPGKAPKTVAAFLKNIEEGVYKNADFYRVLKNEDLPAEYNSGLIQGGIFHSAPGRVEAVEKVPHESPAQTGLTHTSGTLSMARTAPGTATSEFFICIGDQTQFDSSRRTNPDGQGYAAFGRLVSGMKVAREIQSKKNEGDAFTFPIKIKNIVRL